nr:golgin subfamily A member 6-like protein 2 [Quercus suber]
MAPQKGHKVQQGREPLDVSYCSITVDGGLNDELLPQRLHNLARQREELQRMEIEIKAQLISRSEIVELQTTFDARIKEHANATAKLQEQLREREQAVHELERKMEEKDRELHAIKLDNEAAWAKEDLLREQNKELASFRRERGQSEVERDQHIKQMRDLQEHIQEKERQLIELQDQHRVAQETILYKDEQLREAQAWIARVQEMDVLQSNTNHSLQAELRERTEQYNQLWLGCQRQDVSQFGQSNGNQLDANGGGGTSGGNSGVLPNGNSDNVSSFASTGNAPAQECNIL